MRKFMTTMAAGSLSALMALTATAPVQAMPLQPVNGIEQQSNARGSDIQNVDWRDHRRGWDRRHDRRDDWRRHNYRDRHHSHHGNGAAIIGGLAAGAIIGGAIANSNHNRYYYHNGRRYLRD
ncbi:BA14K family protein [Rhizobium sp. 18055]|uniref:BA14K family protein n=1 Tax=Rhizobium sp. 18055 TaxID=2681403 RepID=UPI001FCEEBA7|nr:BA14K family protein [Rhizobium sp. 18055]